jgi:hypothetical protein
MTTLDTKISLIDPTYPVAGQDNDTQGFRDNFSNIQQALELASADLQELQSKAVLKSTIATNNDATNDLGGSSIVNGVYNEFYATAYAPTNPVTTSQDVNLENGSFQAFVMGSNIQFTFKGWPASGIYACVRVHLEAEDPTIPRTATFAAYQGNISYGNSGINTTGWPSTFTVPVVYTRPTTSASPAGADAITVGDVSNLKVGATVIYTPYAGTPNGGETTISAINTTTKVITLADQVETGGILSGDTITFRYTGPRVIEAYSVDGGANVFLRAVADF